MQCYLLYVLEACRSQYDYRLIVREGTCGTAGGYHDNSRMLIIDHIEALHNQGLLSDLTSQI